MKVYYSADSESRSFEGRTSIARTIKSRLVLDGHTFVDRPSKANLLHFHSSGVAASYHANKLKKMYGVPVIYSLYSVSRTQFLYHFKNFFDQKKLAKSHKMSYLLSYTSALPIQLRSFFLNKLDKVIVSSECQKKRLGSNAELIRFGVNTQKFFPLNAPKRSENLHIGYFGHPSAFKGITDYVISTKYLDPNITAHLYVSRVTPELKAFVKKVNPEIIIQGHSQDINKSYNSMDVIVLPFRCEISAISNPLVLLESMSAGSAIVTTNLEFIEEIVQDGAVTVNPYSPKSLALTVNSLLKDKLKLTRLRKRSREIILERYTEKSMLDNYSNLYQKFEK